MSNVYSMVSHSLNRLKRFSCLCSQYLFLAWIFLIHHRFRSGCILAFYPSHQLYNTGRTDSDIYLKWLVSDHAPQSSIIRDRFMDTLRSDHNVRQSAKEEVGTRTRTADSCRRWLYRLRLR